MEGHLAEKGQLKHNMDNDNAVKITVAIKKTILLDDLRGALRLVKNFQFKS